jgi:hypothetical protein
MKIFLYPLVATPLISCSNSAGDQLSSSDSVVVRFTTIGYNDSISKMINTTDRNAIRSIANFTSGTTDMEDAKCGYNGHLLFYENKQEVRSIEFNYAKDGCGQFVWKEGDKWITKKMSNEAADFFQALEKGKSSF